MDVVLVLANSKTLIIVLAGDAVSAQRAAELTPAWGRLGVTTLVLADRGEFSGERTHTWHLGPGSLLDSVLTEGIALQFLACHGAQLLGRDPDRWLGGVRTDLLDSISQITIRGSAVLDSLPDSKG